MAEERIKCPVCAELIKADAKKCRFCGEWLAEGEAAREKMMRREPSELPEEEQVEKREDGSTESEDTLSEPEPLKKAGAPSVKKGRHFPWLRIVLFIAYVAIIAALVCSERTARQFLRDAKTEEEAQNYEAAFDKYSTVIQRYPFSIAVIETQLSLQRLFDAHGFKKPSPSWLEKVETVLVVLRTKLDRELDVSEVYLLSFIGWPVCVVLLALVFLTRILRPGTALFVLVLAAIAGAGSIVQLSWYDTILPEPIVEGLLEEPTVLYGVTYALLVVTALMTLTAMRKRRSRHMSKIAAMKKQ